MVGMADGPGNIRLPRVAFSLRLKRKPGCYLGRRAFCAVLSDNLRSHDVFVALQQGEAAYYEETGFMLFSPPP
jgi:hypothetical protein